MIQRVFLYQVLLIHSLSSTDVPFNNGTYTHGDGLHWFSAFYYLRESGIQSDSSISLLIPFIHSLFQSQTANSISLEVIEISIVLMILCF